MQLVEKHIIKRNHRLYNTCDKLCFASKNIYNKNLYLIRQEYEQTKTYNVFNDSYSYMKDVDCFKQLPPKVAQATLRSVHSICKSFFALLKSDKVQNKNVRFPHYLKKDTGRYITTFNNQTISKKVFNKSHKIKLAKCDIEFYTKIMDFTSINCVRVVPQPEQYTIEVVYTVADVVPLKSNRTYASIDLGVNNLATITYSDKSQPKIVNGRPLKSINQYYNKKLAYYKSRLEKSNKCKSSHRTKKLSNKRNNKVNDYLHKASKYIVSDLQSKCITTLIIGKNMGWKTQCNIGKQNNQNFVQIPHSRFIDMLIYKCEKVGITVKLQEESYTSKCSFLDMEEICKHDTYCGKRVKRGLYISKNSVMINADVNGSYNILRKAIPSAFRHGIEGFVVSPLVVKL